MPPTRASHDGRHWPTLIFIPLPPQVEGQSNLVSASIFLNTKTLLYITTLWLPTPAPPPAAKLPYYDLTDPKQKPLNAQGLKRLKP